MKSGIIRAMDSLGRIVIPMEMRKVLKVKEQDCFEIYVNDQREIVLAPYKVMCVCCGNSDVNKLREHNGVYLCSECIKTFSKEAHK